MNGKNGDHRQKHSMRDPARWTGSISPVHQVVESYITRAKGHGWYETVLVQDGVEVDSITHRKEEA